MTDLALGAEHGVKAVCARCSPGRATLLLFRLERSWTLGLGSVALATQAKVVERERRRERGGGMCGACAMSCGVESRDGERSRETGPVRILSREQKSQITQQISRICRRRAGGGAARSWRHWSHLSCRAEKWQMHRIVRRAVAGAAALAAAACIACRRSRVECRAISRRWPDASVGETL